MNNTSGIEFIHAHEDAKPVGVGGLGGVSQCDGMVAGPDYFKGAHRGRNRVAVGFSD